MTEYNDGKWHGWNGGECPVHPFSLIDYIWCDVDRGKGGKASDGCDDNLRADASPWGKIVAFRVVTPYVEPPKPRECWINEYPSGIMAVHMDAWTAETRRAYYGKTTRWIEVLE